MQKKKKSSSSSKKSTELNLDAVNSKEKISKLKAREILVYIEHIAGTVSSIETTSPQSFLEHVKVLKYIVIVFREPTDGVIPKILGTDLLFRLLGVLEIELSKPPQQDLRISIEILKCIIPIGTYTLSHPQWLNVFKFIQKTIWNLIQGPTRERIIADLAACKKTYGLNYVISEVHILPFLLDSFPTLTSTQSKLNTLTVIRLLSVKHRDSTKRTAMIITISMSILKHFLTLDEPEQDETELAFTALKCVKDQIFVNHYEREETTKRMERISLFEPLEIIPTILQYLKYPNMFEPAILMISNFTFQIKESPLIEKYDLVQVLLNWIVVNSDRTFQPLEEEEYEDSYQDDEECGTDEKPSLFLELLQNFDVKSSPKYVEQILTNKEFFNLLKKVMLQYVKNGIELGIVETGTELLGNEAYQIVSLCQKLSPLVSVEESSDLLYLVCQSIAGRGRGVSENAYDMLYEFINRVGLKEAVKMTRTIPSLLLNDMNVPSRYPQSICPLFHWFLEFTPKKRQPCPIFSFLLSIGMRTSGGGVTLNPFLASFVSQRKTLVKLCAPLVISRFRKRIYLNLDSIRSLKEMLCEPVVVFKEEKENPHTMEEED